MNKTNALKNENNADFSKINLVANQKKSDEKKELWDFFEHYHDSSYILSHDCKRYVSLKDKGETRKYSLENDLKKDLVVYRVDGGVIQGNNSDKCDFAIYTEDKWLVLVELKGADYNKAIEQIISTIDQLVKNPKVSVNRVFSRIVLSKVRTPELRTSAETTLKNIMSQYQGNLKKSTTELKEKLSSI